jgi:hypothetical protein
MDWSASTLWWLLAGVLVAAELATGTFYLLMLALGAAAGALAAHAGLPLTGQVATAAVWAAVRWCAWHLRQARPAAAPAATNRDVNLDIGEHGAGAGLGRDGSARCLPRQPWRRAMSAPGHPVPGRMSSRRARQPTALERAPH